MRVHPSQLRAPIRLGDRLPLVAGIGTLFLLLVLGSAFSINHLRGSSRKGLGQVSAVLLTKGDRVSLFDTQLVNKSGELKPDLSTLEQAFLHEVRSYGELIFIPKSELSGVKTLTEKSLGALKRILLKESRIYAPGISDIYRISEDKVSIIQADGTEVEWK